MDEEVYAICGERSEALQRADVAEQSAAQLQQSVAALDSEKAHLLSASEADRAALASLRESSAAQEQELLAIVAARERELTERQEAAQRHSQESAELRHRLEVGLFFSTHPNAQILTHRSCIAISSI